ncbi:MAG TPA: hypothetical protein VN181_10135, partial [Thermoanaerobaculia bacterium]|nr:hypothetical protein [Thermoanaerobaculia bacterium]
MNCVREEELLDALQRMYLGAELEAHVASCAACSELREVAGAFLDDRAQAVVEAPVPSAGTMWWRMQIRRRQEAATSARRSLLIGQAVTLAIAVALLITFFGADLAAIARGVFASLSTKLLLV